MDLEPIAGAHDDALRKHGTNDGRFNLQGSKGLATEIVMVVASESKKVFEALQCFFDGDIRAEIMEVEEKDLKLKAAVVEEHLLIDVAAQVSSGDSSPVKVVFAHPSWVDTVKFWRVFQRIALFFRGSGFGVVQPAEVGNLWPYPTAESQELLFDLDLAELETSVDWQATLEPVLAMARSLCAKRIEDAAVSLALLATTSHECLPFLGNALAQDRDLLAKLFTSGNPVLVQYPIAATLAAISTSNGLADATLQALRDEVGRLVVMGSPFEVVRRKLSQALAGLSCQSPAGPQSIRMSVLA